MTVARVLAFILVVLLSNFHHPYFLARLLTGAGKLQSSTRWSPHTILSAEAKGVAGLGKAGGDGQGGSDKAGQQVPPEVYMALTYAGTLFLFTLSVPLILYSLNKLLNKIEDCFGCGPSSKTKGGKLKQLEEQKTQLPNKNGRPDGNNRPINSISSLVDQAAHPEHENGLNSRHLRQSQRSLLQKHKQYADYTQFLSMSKADQNFNGFGNNSSLEFKVLDLAPASVPVTTSSICNNLQQPAVQNISTSTRQSQDGPGSFALLMPAHNLEQSKSTT